MKTLWHRLQYLTERRRMEADLAEEIESHRTMIEERLRQSGLSPADARAASRRALGNIVLAREDAREIWIGRCFEGVVQDVRHALRAFARHPGFGLAVAVVAALGIGATTTVFALVDRLILKPLPVSRPGQLVYLSPPSFSYPVFEHVRASGHGIFSGLFAWNFESMHVDWGGQPEPQEVLMASGDMYATLGVTASAGRLLSPDDDRSGGGAAGMVAVISDACWTRRFARDPSVIGRSIRIDRRPFTIVGVTPAGFFGVAPGLAPEVTIPLTVLVDARALASTSSDWVHLMARRRDGVALAQANAAVRQFWPQVLEGTLGPQMPSDRRAQYLGRPISLVSAASGYSRVRNGFADPLWLLFGLVGLLFAVGCASTANLMVARTAARQKELAIRLSIGASRWRVIRQVLTESLVWVGIGALGGLLVSAWAGELLVALLTTRAEPIALDLSTDWRIASFALGLTLLTVVLCALWPAVRAAASTAAPRAAGAMTGWWSFGKAVVVVQVTLTMLLVVGAALFVRSLSRIVAQDTGLDRRGVIVVAADAGAAGYSEARLAHFNTDLETRLAAIPGVASVSLSVMPPISDEEGTWTQNIGIDGAAVDRGSGQAVYFNAVSPAFFRTVGLGVLSGREFTDRDNAAGVPVVAVNRTLAARFFPGGDPIGRRLTMGRAGRRRVLEIVAVVADSKYQRLQEAPRSIAYLPVAQQGLDSRLVAEVRGAGRTDAIAAAVRGQVRAIDPSVPVHVESVDDRIAASLVTERVMAVVATALGLTALVLACAALYGLLAYAASRQTREIGVRLALGARRGTVVWMVLRHSLAVTIAGVAAGSGAALALGRFARNLLYQISPNDLLSLAAAAALMIAVAALAALLPSLRAARIDPADALKAE